MNGATDPEPQHAASYGAAWRPMLAPLAAVVLIALEQLHIVEETSVPFLALAGTVLVATVFSAVHFAEIISARVGEPFGSIVLAGAVTVIEVALIVSMMLAPSEGDVTVARDTVFATVMLV
ncbi:MAG: ionic transporter y4hA, partial [Nitratireductor sp.]